MRIKKWHVVAITTVLVLTGIGITIYTQLIRTTTHQRQETASPTKTLNDFVLTYNESAVPTLPPDYSASAGIWNLRDGIPARPVNTEPQFIDHPANKYPPYDPGLLANAKCSGTTSDWTYTCQDDSPLRDFDCEEFANPQDLSIGLEPAYLIVAACWKEPDYANNMNDKYLYRIGCERPFNTSFIFEIDGGYVLVNTAEEMQELFAPIDSPEEALSYARILTGMYPLYDFSYKPDYMIYYLDVIEATHITTTDNGYIVHLYHSDECGCDTWLTSQVDVVINSAGSMEWGKVAPVYQKVCVGLCLD